MEVDFNKLQWSKFKEDFKNQFGEHPSVISALFVVGLSEIKQEIEELSKEQKQDVIHVGLSTLLEKEGFYKRLNFDAEGWPHFEVTDKAQTVDIEKQEPYIRTLILNHFGYE